MRNSLTKPLNGGSAEMASPPSRKKRRRPRHAPGQPAQPLQVDGVGRAVDGAGRVEEQALEEGVVEQVQDPAGEAERHQHRLVPGQPEVARPRSPIPAMPTFSVEE